jgi:hypothetical protein
MSDQNPTLDLTPPAATEVRAATPPAYAAPAVPAADGVSGAVSSAYAAPGGRSASAAADSATAAAPRTRWAAIIWGLLLAAISATALWVTVDAGRRDAVAEWIVALSPAAIAAYLLLAAAAIALVSGLVGIARRVQRGAERRRAASVPSPL